ncbi:diphthine methyltransferase-like isoform X2 [Dreissena polymorpha]|uniref:diphthine methyltransferase-like isoform X2 n=1 Tax=Dreissena polymorpha TaxID=45954 RepID=UPI0022644B1D|nr:diphthine methyltransferase-like isoform X2 [Dreissena polymorpha]
MNNKIIEAKFSIPNKLESTESAGEQTRVGCLYMYSLDTQSGVPTLQQCTRLDMPGVLDIKWSCEPVQGHPTFALVNSIGELQLYKLGSNKAVSIETKAELSPHSLGLSLEWNNLTGHSEDLQIVSSDSSGHVHVHQLGGASLDTIDTWKAHDYEAWISAFNQANTQLVFTGGDDCRLKGWDLRAGTASPVFNSKRHTMGVCSIQSNPIEPHMLATGSYDEHLLVWDTRQMKSPTQEVDLGGGVWRVKWEPNTARYILTATMYNGFHVLDMTGESCSIASHYSEHQSIGYGADWCRLPSKMMDFHGKQFTASASTEELQLECSNTRVKREHCQNVISTCSFYDHLLKLWTFSDCTENTE